MSKQKSKTTAEARKDRVEKVLHDLGHQVYNDLDNSRFPSVTFASRSVSNIVYDKKLQQFILGSSIGQEVGGEHQAHQAVHPAALARLLLEEARRREEDLDAQRRLLLRPGLRRGVPGPGRVGRAHHRPRGPPGRGEGGVQRLPGGEERDLREPDDRVHRAGLRGKEARPLGPPGRDDDWACHDDRGVRGHRRGDSPRHREGRPLHEVHRGEGPREVQGDTHQHARVSRRGRPGTC